MEQEIYNVIFGLTLDIKIATREGELQDLDKAEKLSRILANLTIAKNNLTATRNVV